MRISNANPLLLAGLLLTTSLTLADARAAENHEVEPTMSGPHALFAKGRQKFSFELGYGEGFPAFSAAGKDSADARTAAVVGGWGVSISDVEGSSAWYRGTWEVLIEGVFTLQAEPQLGHGGGATLNFRYNFLSSQRLVPFMGIGAGLAGMDFDLNNSSDGFNFILQAGPGVHYFLTDHVALTGEVRWHHYSNAQTRRRNGGVNTALILVGATFFFD